MGLLKREKEMSRQRDELNAARRRLPMVEVSSDIRRICTQGTPPWYWSAHLR